MDSGVAVAIVSGAAVVVAAIIKVPWPKSASTKLECPTGRYVSAEVCEIQHNETNRRLDAIDAKVERGFERLEKKIDARAVIKRIPAD